MSFDWSYIIEPSERKTDAEMVRQFEEALEFDLPQDYRDFLLQLNGGRVLFSNTFRISEIPFDLGVSYIYPLTVPRPFMGIVEIRHVQMCNHLCLRQALNIADCYGVGGFYLLLAGAERGRVYYIWNDDESFYSLSAEEWESREVRIPKDMVEVSPTFDSLGQMILNGRVPEGGH